MLTAPAARAQKPVSEIDFNSLQKDLSLNRSTGNDLQMAVWMPNVYWEVVGKITPGMTPEVQKELLRMVDDYIIICVVNAKMNMETLHFETTPESILRKKVTFEVNGRSLKPLYYNELTDEAQQIKSIVEPLFGKMLGELGDGMTVLFLKSKDENGKYLVDPYVKANFVVHFGESSLTYNLPLPALYYDKLCPTDNATFPANYTYCPFHGVELREPEATGAGK
jgi:hypothetical protein